MTRSRLDKLCFVLLLLCIPAVILPVFYTSTATWKRLHESKSAMAELLKSIRPLFPTWTQYFALQTVCALLAVALTARLLEQRRTPLPEDAPGRKARWAFPALAIGYAVWGGLSVIWAPWRYGATAYIIRELPYYFVGVAAFVVCAGKPGRWIWLARTLAVCILISCIRQIGIILGNVPGETPTAWALTSAEPIRFGTPFIGLLIAAMGLLICMVAFFAIEKQEDRRIAWSPFVLCTILGAGCMGLLILRAFQCLPLKKAFLGNPAMFGNVNFGVAAVVTAMFIVLSMVLDPLRSLHARMARRRAACEKVPPTIRTTAGDAGAKPAPPPPEESTESDLADVKDAFTVIVALAAFGVMGFILALSDSLAGQLALLGAGAVYALWMLPLEKISRDPRRRTALRTMAVAVPIVLGLLVTIVALAVPAWQRGLWAALTKPESTTHLRAVYWAAAADMVKARPIQGWGMGSFQAVYPTFRPDVGSALQYVRWIRPTHPHNEYVRAFCEQGIVGLALYLGVIATAFGSLWFRMERLTGKTRSTALALLAGASAFAIQNLFGKAPMMWLPASCYWLLLGIMASAVWLPSGKKAAAAPAGGADAPAPVPPTIPVPPTAAEPRRGLRIEDWIIVAIVAVLLAWGWNEWARGALLSQHTMAQTEEARGNMHKPGTGWAAHESMVAKIAEEKPRSLWPSHVVYHEYADPWYLYNNGYSPRALRKFRIIHEQGFWDFLKIRMLMGSCSVISGDMETAARELPLYLASNPYDYRPSVRGNENGYDALATVDPPLATMLLENLVATIEKTGGTLPEKETYPEALLMLGRLYEIVDKHREQLADPQGYLADHPHDVWTKSYIRFRAAMDASEDAPAVDYAPRLKLLLVKKPGEMARQIYGRYLGHEWKSEETKKEEDKEKVRALLEDDAVYPLYAAYAPEAALEVLQVRVKQIDDDSARIRNKLKRERMPFFQLNQEIKSIRKANGTVGRDLRRLERLRKTQLRIFKEMLAILDRRGQEGIEAAGDNAAALASRCIGEDLFATHAYRTLHRYQPEKAIQLVQANIRHTGANSILHLELARMLQETKPKEAVKELLECLRQRPTRMDAWHLLAELDREQAIAHLWNLVTQIRPGASVKEVKAIRVRRRMHAKLLAELLADTHDDLKDKEDEVSRERDRNVVSLAETILKLTMQALPRDVELYRLLHRIAPEEAVKQLEAYVTETADYDHVEAVKLLLTWNAQAGRWTEATALLAKVCEGEAPRMRRWMAIASVAEMLADQGLTDAAERLSAQGAAPTTED